jgi:transcriptional regulator GlxA family with amidase domain
MSRRSLERRFRAVLSISPTREMIRLRLQKVQRELLGTRRTIKEIAMNSGFCSSEHLQKQFRHRFGTSPDAWRKLNRPSGISRNRLLCGFGEPESAG